MKREMKFEKPSRKRISPMHLQTQKNDFDNKTSPLYAN
jgi:hypothetical protein